MAFTCRKESLASRRILLAAPLIQASSPAGEFAARLVAEGGNAIELRADALCARDRLSIKKLAKLAAELRAQAPRAALILTPRSRREGGVATLSTARRRALIESSLEWADAIDVELRSARFLQWAAPRIAQAGKLLILSWHDFRFTPSRTLLARILRKAAAYPDAILKIAATPAFPNDLTRLMAWTWRAARERPLAVMAMGPEAGPARLALAALGSRLAFASVGEASAPGQVPMRRFAPALKQLRPLAARISSDPGDKTFARLLRHAEALLSNPPREEK